MVVGECASPLAMSGPTNPSSRVDCGTEMSEFDGRVAGSMNGSGESMRGGRPGLMASEELSQRVRRYKQLA